MKRILGLDLGTNSIGWAIVKAKYNNEEIQLMGIEAAGSRIIPMDAATWVILIVEILSRKQLKEPDYVVFAIY